MRISENCPSIIPRNVLLCQGKLFYSAFRYSPITCVTIPLSHVTPLPCHMWHHSPVTCGTTPLSHVARLPCHMWHHSPVTCGTTPLSHMTPFMIALANTCIRDMYIQTTPPYTCVRLPPPYTCVRLPPPYTCVRLPPPTYTCVRLPPPYTCVRLSLHLCETPPSLHL